jgi:hypothetical protein
MLLLHPLCIAWVHVHEVSSLLFLPAVFPYKLLTSSCITFWCLSIHGQRHLFWFLIGLFTLKLISNVLSVFVLCIRVTLLNHCNYFSSKSVNKFLISTLSQKSFLILSHLISLYYKPEWCGLNSHVIGNSVDLTLPAALWPWADSACNRNEYQEYSEDKGQLARKADNLTAICEPIV